MQAPIFDSVSFDPFTLFDDGFRPAEVGIGRRSVSGLPNVKIFTGNSRNLRDQPSVFV